MFSGFIMSQKNQKPQVPPTPKNIQMTQEIRREDFNNALGQSKRRISQRKGEMLDAMGDQITQEFAGIGQGIMQLFDQIDVLKRRIAELESPPTTKE